MISPSVLTVIRAVPYDLAIGVMTGRHQIFGSVIKDAMTGRIVGHLQETAALGAIHPLLGLANMAVDTAGLVTDGVILDKVTRMAGTVEAIQSGVEKVQKAVDLLKMLGIADLALGAAGIGVSAVGFAVMSAKIERVSRAVEGLSDQLHLVSQQIERLHANAILAELSNVRGLANAYEEAWLLSASAGEERWRRIAYDLHQVQFRMETIAQQEFIANGHRYDSIDPVLDAMGLIGALRVSSLMASNEVDAAKAAAQDSARRIELVTGNIGMAELTRVFFREPKADPASAAWLVAQAHANQAARPIVKKIRHREAAALTMAAPLDELDRLGITPRDWMEAARGEGDEPLIYLPLEV